MNRCTRCVMTDTRPDTPFTDDVCQACINHANRQQIDWDGRKQELLLLLERHGGRVIVPSSGGKDSTYIALKMLEFGGDVTVVTASTCFLTEIGRNNIDNLARYCRTIEVSPNKTVRSKLNRLGLELVGDISWPEHASIFSVPFRMAKALGHTLIMFGENPQTEYGGPQGTEEARQMTKRWTSEFGGFLGLRPSDFVGVEDITESDMQDYTFPSDIGNVEAHFLGQYIPWDSARNAQVSIEHGMRVSLPSLANYWVAENLDNVQTGLHDHSCYRKYGYGRLAAQASVDVRNGWLKREKAMELVRERDGLFPEEYAGVSVIEVLDRIGMSRDELMKALDKFTNWELFDHVEDGRPILKEFA